MNLFDVVGMAVFGSLGFVVVTTAVEFVAGLFDRR